MKKLYAYVLAALMAVTATPLMAANGNPTPPPPPQPVQTMPVGVRSTAEITAAALVGALLIGGGTFFLTNRRKGGTQIDLFQGPTPFMFYIHGSSDIP